MIYGTYGTQYMVLVMVNICGPSHGGYIWSYSWWIYMVIVTLDIYGINHLL